MKLFVVYENGVNVGIWEEEDIVLAGIKALQDIKNDATEFTIRETEKYFPD